MPMFHSDAKLRRRVARLTRNARSTNLIARRATELCDRSLTRRPRKSRRRVAAIRDCAAHSRRTKSNRPYSVTEAMSTCERCPSTTTMPLSVT
jgi:hypothetical protein